MSVLGKEKTYVLQLQNVDEKDINLVSTEGLRAASLTNYNINLPPCFIITSLAFDDFLTAANLVDDILVSLGKVKVGDHVSAETVSLEIREMILAANYPSLLLHPLMHALNALSHGRPSYVELRPGWIISNDDSLLESVDLYQYRRHHVVGEENLLVAIKEIWCSLFSASAIFERAKQHYAGPLSVAVIVQKMIPAEVSGIAASYDLTHGHSNICTVQATYGSFQPTTGADIYQVDKDTQRVTEKILAAQARMHLLRARPILDGEPELIVPVSPTWQGKQKLEDKHVSYLCQVVTQLEEDYGHPLSVGFSLQSGNIYIHRLNLLPTPAVSKSEPVTAVENDKPAEGTKTQTIDFDKLVAEVDREAVNLSKLPEPIVPLTNLALAGDKLLGAGELTATAQTIGSVDLELAIPGALTTIYLALNDTQAETLQFARKFPAVAVDLPSILRRNRISPMQLKQDSPDFAQLAERIAADLGVIASSSSKSTVLVEFYDSANSTLSDEQAEQLINSPDQLTLEYIALKKAQRDYGIGKYQLVLPPISSESQFMELRKILGLSGLRRSEMKQLGIDISLPASLYVLPKLAAHDIDFVYLSLERLALSTLGRVPRSESDQLVVAERLSEVVTQARKHKFQIIIKLDKQQSLLSQVVPLLPSGLIFSEVPSATEVELLTELAKSQLVSPRRRGRRIKQI